MDKEAKKKISELSLAGLALLAFVVLTPSAAYKCYRIGAGLSYDKQLETAGLSHQQSIVTADHEIKVSKAKRDGVIYAALMVNGLHLPLLGLVLITTGIVMRRRSRTAQKYLKIVFPLLCLWGTVSFGLAGSMLGTMPLSATLMGASLIWLVIAVFFGTVILTVAIIRRFAN